MTHAPRRGPAGPPRSLRRATRCRPVTIARARADLRAALALACLDGATAVPLDLLGAGPVRSPAEETTRIDTLIQALLDHMDAEGWDPGAVPRAVTSVLAASVPAAEAALLRAAGRPRQGEVL